MDSLLTPTSVATPVARQISRTPAARRRGTALGRRAVELVCVPLSWLLGSRSRGAFGILTYHRIAPHVDGAAEPTCNVTPRQFRAQLEGLLALGFRPLSLREALDYARRGEPVPPKRFVVTFDDGYENVYRYAWPILEELRIPATIFLATAYLDRDEPFPFDDWCAAGSPDVPEESWRPLTTEQCRQMQESELIEFGSHTHTHADFHGRPEALRAELRQSLDVLRSRLGLDDATFSFPFGVCGTELSEAARDAGVLCALTRDDDVVEPQSDPFAWGRFAPLEEDSAAILAGKLDGWYGRARRAWLSARNLVSTVRNASAETRATILKGVYSIADQGVVSGASFLTSLMIGRFCSQAELGLYFLAINLLIFFRDAQSNLTTAPFSVYYHHRPGKESASYAGSTWIHQVVLTTCAVLGMLAVARWLPRGSGPSGIHMVLLATAAATPFVLMLKNMRDYSLVRLQTGTALAFDSLAAAAQLCGLLALFALHSLSAATAYLVIGAVSGVGLLIWVVMRRPQMTIERSRILPDWRHNWNFGRWALASQMLGCSATYVMPWIVAFSHGEAATGLLAACTLLVNFAGTFVSGMANFALPKASRAYAQEGIDAMRRVLLSGAALFTITLGAFFLLLLLFGDRLTTAIFGAQYAGAGPVLAILALNMLVNSLGMTAGWGLWAIHRPKANFTADAGTLALTLGLTACLIGPLGVYGAALAILAGTLLGTVVRVAALGKALRDLRGDKSSLGTPGIGA